jgi:alpha-soluble NSF attachment protein
VVDLEKSLKHYEAAGELYSGEDSSGLASQCWLKVATFAAQLEKYDVAVERFEQVATASLENNLTKYSAKQYFMQAALCHMVKDIVSARRAVEKYQDMDMTFGQSRECQLLVQLLDAFDAGDQPKFTSAVAEYDRLTKLDAWKTTMLLRIKKMIAEEPSLT